MFRVKRIGRKDDTLIFQYVSIKNGDRVVVERVKKVVECLLKVIRRRLSGLKKEFNNLFKNKLYIRLKNRYGLLNLIMLHYVLKC